MFISLIIPDSIAQNAIWITNWGSNTVTKLNPDGTTVGTFAVGLQPWGIAVDESGNVWGAHDSPLTNWPPVGVLP